MGIKEEGKEDGEDAGPLHHQADPDQAPKHEQQPSTICLLTNPKCPMEAPLERVHPLVQLFQSKNCTM